TLTGSNSASTYWRKENVKEPWQLNNMPWHTGSIQHGPMVEDIAFKRSQELGLDPAIILNATSRILADALLPQSAEQLYHTLDRVALATRIVGQELEILRS